MLTFRHLVGTTQQSIEVVNLLIIYLVTVVVAVIDETVCVDGVKISYLVMFFELAKSTWLFGQNHVWRNIEFDKATLIWNLYIVIWNTNLCYNWG